MAKSCKSTGQSLHTPPTRALYSVPPVDNRTHLFRRATTICDTRFTRHNEHATKRRGQRGAAQDSSGPGNEQLRFGKVICLTFYKMKEMRV